MSFVRRALTPSMAVALLALPGDTARIAGLLGLAVAGCFAWMPARPARTLATAGVAAAFAAHGLIHLGTSRSKKGDATKEISE